MARLELPPDGSGRRRRTAFYGATRAEALHKLRLAQAALLHAGQEPLNQKLLVRTFLHEWLTTAAAPHIRPKTLTQYTHIVDAYLVPGLGAVQLAQLKPAQVQAFLTKVAHGTFVPVRQPRRGNPTTHHAGARTVQQCYRVLYGALAQAARWGLVHRNVAALVDPPTVPKAATTALTADQARTLLTATAGTRWGPLWALAIYTGLRRGELLGLRWADVDLDHALLHVRGALAADGTRIPPKTAQSARPVPLGAEAVKVLQARRTAQRRERVAAGAWQRTDLVFTTLAGGALRGDNVWRAFQTDLTAAGLPHVRFHDLRHTCASLLAAQGVPLQVIQQLLGHTTIRTTADMYVHPTPDAARAAVAVLDSLLADAG
jgi:integrase